MVERLVAENDLFC